MRICENCGSPIPDGSLFCPKCGEEVHLVPDYETMESRVMENQLREEEEQERQRELARLAEEAALEKRKKKKKAIIIAVISLLAAVAVVLAVVVVTHHRRTNSFDYQYKMALEAYEAKNYGEAQERALAALKIKKTDAKARLLLGEIYEAMDNPEEAIKAYEQLISDHNDYEEAYDHLIPLYVDAQNYEGINEVLENCKSEEIQKKFEDYRTYEVSFGLKAGSYSSLQSVSLSSDGDGDIYYTTDGSDPTETSNRYTSPISLQEGSTTLRARYISAKQIPGEIAEADYEITLTRASAPVITPSSGTYSSTEATRITVEVPEGYTAYYSFDTRATKNSTQYTSPVSMPEGSHIFCAVLVDANGNEGDVASATYVYTRVTPTPTATPKAQNPQSVATPSAATATPTPTPTTASSSDDEEWEGGM
jgi:tetratricopeptide (TPR) repeat protein